MGSATLEEQDCEQHITCAKSNFLMRTLDLQPALLRFS